MTPKTCPPVDVLICGGGSAGICAAAWLSRLGIQCKILERRPGPLEIGQADGVQCRTVEVFDSFGLAEDLLREAYHVLEVTFWATDSEGGIKRTRRSADTEVGLSHQPHVILNQARVNGILVDAMKKWTGQQIDFGYVVKSVSVDSKAATDPASYPVTVVAEKDGNDEIFKAKYVLGCDGAHSQVRRSLGFKMVGDTTDSVWGVMDVYPRTNFPDIRRKLVLQTDTGSIVVIPREGGSLVRVYMELPAGTVAKEVTLESLHETARRLFAPYKMDFADTFWWSAYSIGQRVADYFTAENRVFLTGDACHTHSPKAGQGMNTSLQDGYNIGWKLGAILRGQAGPEILETYTIERAKVAHDLINFDRELTSLLSSKAAKEDPDYAAKFSNYFIQTAKYTAGLTAKYGDSCFTNAAQSMQSLATNVVVGMRLPSTQVVRHCDSKAMQLVKALPADGRWRILIFAGNISRAENAVRLDKVYLLEIKYMLSSRF
jgi:phenol 2-monooxygenase